MNEYEQLLADEYWKLKITEGPYFELKRVVITFNQIELQAKPALEWEYHDDGIMTVGIKDASIDNGLRNALASMIHENIAYLPSQMGRDYMLALIPLAAFDISLYVCGEYALPLGNLLLSMFLGPGLFSLITLPIMSLFTRKRRNDIAKLHHIMTSTLEKSSLYNREEIEVYTARYLGHQKLGYIWEYILYIPMFILFILLVLYLH